MNNTEVVWVCALTACLCHTVTQKSQNPSVGGDMAALFQKMSEQRGEKKNAQQGRICTMRPSGMDPAEVCEEKVSMKRGH